jgi:hypothetical protein
MQNHHPQRWIEPGFGLLEQVVLEPASLRPLALEDHDLVHRHFQQGVLSRLDRIGVAHLARGLDAVRAKLFVSDDCQQAARHPPGLLLHLVRVHGRRLPRVRRAKRQP